MSARRLFLAAALLAPAAAPLQAQQVAVACEPGRTVQQCYERFRPSGGVPDTVKKEAVGQVAERLQAKQTGADLSPEGPLTTIRDFLPRLAANLLAPTMGNDATALGLKLNLPLNDGVLFDWGFTGQLAAVANEPKPFAPLVDSIPQTLREAARTRLQEEMEPYDDVTLTAAFNLENRVFGRGMRQHRPTIDALAEPLLQPSGTAITRLDEANMEYVLFQARLGSAALADGAAHAVVAADRAEAQECKLRAPGGPRDAGAMRFDCFTPAWRDSVERRVARVAAVAEQNLRETEARIRASGFLRLAQLINNQPQLNVSADYRSRRDVVGPNEWKGTARFELGFANMNGLRRYCGARLDADCLRRYTQDDGVKGSLSRGDRVFVQADFTRRNSWHVRLPDDSVDLALGTATTFALSGGYGAYFGNAEDGENRDRVDLQAKYDFTGDDALRQNRFVSTLFYTRRLSDQSSAVFGITYANRPEFLGDVDNKIRANLGLTYKLNQPKESVAGTSSQ